MDSSEVAASSHDKETIHFHPNKEVTNVLRYSPGLNDPSLLSADAGSKTCAQNAADAAFISATTTEPTLGSINTLMNFNGVSFLFV